MRALSSLLISAAIVLTAAPMANSQQTASTEHRETALDRYIQAPATHLERVKLGSVSVEGIECTELRMVSQSWRGISWRHQLFLARPPEPEAPEHGVLVIGGGTQNDLRPKSRVERGEVPQECRFLARAAQLTGQTAAMLKQVPNQPLFDGLTEDDLISHTFDRFLDNPKEKTWPVLLPMTRAAVSALDTLQSYSEENFRERLEHFTLTGESKRGWTTWLTAAVDDRVAALAPMVFDILNMGPQLKHQVQTWGSHSERISAYSEKGLTEVAESPEGKELIATVDPYHYRERITQPKLIALGTNDPYWPLDALNLYWDGLRGEKYALYAPNRGHGITGENVYRTVAALARSAAGEFGFPELNWNYKRTGSATRLEISPGADPLAVRLWRAGSTDRDFRDADFTATGLKPDGSGRYRTTIDHPSRGYRAVFAEIDYRIQGHRFSLSTRVRILEPEGGGADHGSSSSGG